MSPYGSSADEDEYNEETLKLNGSLIEAFEVVEDDNSGKVRIFHRIVCLKEAIPEQNSNDEEDDNDAVTDDSFFDALLFGCVGGCDPCVSTFIPQPPTKSILKNGRLKRQQEGSSPGLAHSMTTRTVSFSSIDIKEFRMTLGDHPSATSGPPMRLDWGSKPIIDRVVSLDEFEETRSLQRRKRRQLKIPYAERKAMLLEEQGFTPAEVNSAWNEALKIRQQRYETLHHGISPYQINVDAFVESVQRKYNRLTNNVILPSVTF
jgi:hypothetical protein